MPFAESFAQRFAPATYRFEGIDLNEVYDLPHHILQALPGSGIQRMRIEYSRTEYTEHLLNKAGYILKTYRVYPDPKHKNRTLKDSTLFSYNSSGVLVAVRRWNDNLFVQDSMTYDVQGRLIYYHSELYDLKGLLYPRNEMVLIHRLRLLSSSDSGTVLLDSNRYDTDTEYSFDNRNRNVKIREEPALDSLSVQASGNTRTYTYWHNNHGRDSVMCKGKEEIYEDGLLIRENTYMAGSPAVSPYCERRYIYDRQYRKLVAVEAFSYYQCSPPLLYTYNSDGWVSSETRVLNREAKVSSYRYYKY
ncbi:MAG: hypothetical protein IBJ09_08150 [Bacteroidia bacterium]|nr:hypothetical protein [Bacteroidia bacterium]